MPRIPQHLIDADARRVRPDRPEPEVRYSADDARVEDPNRWSLYTPAASQKQMNLIRTLLSERDWSSMPNNFRQTCQALASGRDRILTRPVASSVIENLMNMPRIREGSKATPRQIDYIRSMAVTLKMTIPEDLSDMSFDIASRMIGKLKERVVAMRQGSAVTEDGMYVTPDGLIYKVQVAVHGSGKLYAKRLDEVREGVWEFVRDESGMSRLTPEMRMTQEMAQRFGQLYGVCVRCGATLTDEESIEYGIGPICRSKI